MDEIRSFTNVDTRAVDWHRLVRLYRHRGTWAFHAYGFIWCRKWGFKSKLTALRAAGRWLGKEWKLIRKEQSA